MGFGIDLAHLKRTAAFCCSVRAVTRACFCLNPLDIHQRLAISLSRRELLNLTEAYIQEAVRVHQAVTVPQLSEPILAGAVLSVHGRAPEAILCLSTTVRCKDASSDPDMFLSEALHSERLLLNFGGHTDCSKGLVTEAEVLWHSCGCSLCIQFQLGNEEPHKPGAAFAILNLAFYWLAGTELAV